MTKLPPLDSFDDQKFMKLTIKEAKMLLEAAGWKIDIKLDLAASTIHFVMERKDQLKNLV